MSTANLALISGEYIYYALTDASGAPAALTNVASWPALSWSGAESYNAGDGVIGNSASYLSTGKGTVADDFFDFDGFTTGGMLIAFRTSTTNVSLNKATQGVFGHGIANGINKGVQARLIYNTGYEVDNAVVDARYCAFTASGIQGGTDEDQDYNTIAYSETALVTTESHYAIFISPNGDGQMSGEVYRDGFVQEGGLAFNVGDVAAYKGLGLALMCYSNGAQVATNLLNSGSVIHDFLAVKTQAECRGGMNKLVYDLAQTKRQIPTTVTIL